MVNIYLIIIAYKFFDTPGLPIYSQVTTHMEDTNYLKHILPTKMPGLNYIEANIGNSIWIGGLCRIDVVQCSSGIMINPYISREISLLKTTIAKSNQTYITNPVLFPKYSSDLRNIQFEQYVFDLEI